MTIDTLRDKARDAAAAFDQEISTVNTDLANYTAVAQGRIESLTADRDKNLAAANSLDTIDPVLKAILDGLTGEAPAVATETAEEPEAVPVPAEETPA